MNVRILDARDDPPDKAMIEHAAAVLRDGRLLIYPTDTLYALGARALDALAVSRVTAAKGREHGKPLPLVVADLGQARTIVGSWPAAATRLARSFWPGPLTLVLHAREELPVGVTGGSGTVALRVPARGLVRVLCEDVGPLVSTSANRAGESAPSTCAEAVAAVGDFAALALDAGPLGRAPSTLVDVTTDPPRLLRAGAIAWEAVSEVLRSRG